MEEIRVARLISIKDLTKKLSLMIKIVIGGEIITIGLLIAILIKVS